MPFRLYGDHSAGGRRSPSSGDWVERSGSTRFRRQSQASNRDGHEPDLLGGSIVFCACRHVGYSYPVFGAFPHEVEHRACHSNGLVADWARRDVVERLEHIAYGLIAADEVVGNLLGMQAALPDQQDLTAAQGKSG